MRHVLPLALALTAPLGVGCAADPTPQANGFNVELWFDAPSTGIVVGTREAVSVKRIQTQYARCVGATASCDPNAPTPIDFIAAACDDEACTVDRAEAQSDGGLVLAIVGKKEGPTTLRVRVKDRETGAEIDDAYPIVVQFPRSLDEHRAIAPLR